MSVLHLPLFWSNNNNSLKFPPDVNSQWVKLSEGLRFCPDSRDVNYDTRGTVPSLSLLCCVDGGCLCVALKVQEER